MLQKLRNEPVRVWMYSLLTPGIALLVAYGVVDQESAALWFALAAGVLGVGSVERARSLVAPVADSE